MTDEIVEGVFAIHKPQSISSAQVIRDVQSHFNPSKLFAPWIEEESARLKDARKHHHKQRFRKSHEKMKVKIGHGGTLDPMATGVLVLGVGSGTKRLGDFQSKCTKSYETVVLFGQATDTYDIMGKTVARKPFDHITKEKVEQALDKFRGDSMQRPPVYSALRVQGKRLYEYAREGKEIPIEIQERPVTVHELELLEWFDGGSHPYHWPKETADEADQKVAEKVLSFGESAAATVTHDKSEDNVADHKRAREEDTTENGPDAKRVKQVENDAVQESVAQAESQPESRSVEPEGHAESQEPCPAPACRIRMNVTSGFYVRSLCHDLGESLESLGTMAALVRTKQAEFELGKNVFEYDELAKGEDVWAPQIRDLISRSASQIES